MRLKHITATFLACSLLSVPATAQVGGSSTGGGSSIGGGSSVGGGSIGGSSGTDLGGSGIGTTGTGGAETSGTGVGTDLDPSGLQTDPVDATTLRATEGTSEITSTNAGALARSGTTGTSSVTSFGGSGLGTAATASSEFESVAGSGSPELYSIPDPSIGVDLGSIRSGLASGSAATPKANGD